MSFGYQVLGFGAFPNRGADSYQPAGALWLDGSADYLTWTPTGAGSSTSKGTVSFWFKQTTAAFSAASPVLVAGADGNNYAGILMSSAERWVTARYNSSSGSDVWEEQTNGFMRDTTAWQHVVVSHHHTDGTAADRIKIYINGTHEDGQGSPTNPGTSQALTLGSAVLHSIGKLGSTGTYVQGYLADLVYLDGQAIQADDLAITDLGETDSSTGIWVPKDPSELTFGTNGFFLNFADGRYPGLDVQSSATGDADFGVKHLMHFDGSDAATSATDNGLSAASITFTGNAQLDTSVKKFGTASLLLDGSGDEVSFTCPVFGTDNYTIDFWIYPLSSTHNNAAIMGNRAGSGDDCLIIYFKSGYNNRVAMDTPMSNIHLGSSSTELSINTWYHVAFTFDGSKNRQFINGTLVGTTSTSFNLNRTETWRIGQDNSGNKPNDLNGHIDELRIVHGVCKWTASFTPETSAYSNPTKNNSFIASSITATNFAAEGPANSTDKEISIYPTIDPVGPWNVAENTLSDNNMTWISGAGSNKFNYSTIPISNTEKVYFEVHQSGNSGGSHTPGFGITKHGHPGGDNYPGGQSDESDWGFYVGTGSTTTGVDIKHDAADATNAAGNAVDDQAGGADGDVYMCARHGANLWFGANGTWYDGGDPGTGNGDPTDGGTTAIFASGRSPLPTNVPLWVAFHSYGSQAKLTWRPYSSQWKYSAPSGYGEMKSTITGTGNYCTLNPISRFGQSSSTSITLSEGNLKSAAGDTNNKSVMGTMCIPPSGKWYFEARVDAVGGASGSHGMGIRKVWSYQSAGIGADSNARVYIGDGDKGNGSTTTYGASWSAGNTIGVAVDMDNGALYFAINNTWQASGVPTSGSSKTNAAYTDLLTAIADTGYLWAPVHEPGNGTLTFNFGADGFNYTPPTDYKALATHNLPEPTVTDPSAYFQTKTYTGNGDTNAQTFDGNSDMQPDFIWIKCRNNSRGHVLVDSVRGGASYIHSDAQSAQTTASPNNLVTAFGPDGFTLGDISNANADTETFVAWCMKAGGSASTTSPAGTLASSTSVAAHGGFSIGTYTGHSSGNASTIGHGLSRKPSWIIVKNLDNGVQSWTIWQEDLYAVANDKYMAGLDNDGPMTNGTAFNSAEPTDEVFSVGNNAATNSSDDYVFYAFAKTPGLIASGSYVGNNNADGSYVIVNDGASGFRPAWVMVKRIESGYSWHIQNSAMAPYNPAGGGLNANDTGTESTTGYVDFISNGFKLRTTNGGYNGSATYIYLAFAERPFALNNRAR